MEDFMLLAKGDGTGQSPEQMQKKLENYMAWMQKWKAKGQYVEGSPFRTEGNLLLNREQMISEGEFLDPNETIGGFIWIKASDMEEATEIARECPLLDGCGLYVRPFLKM